MTVLMPSMKLLRMPISRPMAPAPRQLLGEEVGDRGPERPDQRGGGSDSERDPLGNRDGGQDPLMLAQIPLPASAVVIDRLTAVAGLVALSPAAAACWDLPSARPACRCRAPARRAGPRRPWPWQWSSSAAPSGRSACRAA